MVAGTLLAAAVWGEQAADAAQEPCGTTGQACAFFCIFNPAMSAGLIC
jgi:hypothetical protein